MWARSSAEPLAMRGDLQFQMHMKCSVSKHNGCGLTLSLAVGTWESKETKSGDLVNRHWWNGCWDLWEETSPCLLPVRETPMYILHAFFPLIMAAVSYFKKNQGGKYMAGHYEKSLPDQKTKFYTWISQAWANPLFERAMTAKGMLFDSSEQGYHVSMQIKFIITKFSSTFSEYNNKFSWDLLSRPPGVYTWGIFLPESHRYSYNLSTWR